MSRNKAFDLLKIFFTIVIVVHHTGYFAGILNRGYIAVEFFFITSGYFLYQTYKKDKSLSTVEFFKKRAERLYPEYWFAFVLIFFALTALHALPYQNWYSPILEFLMLHSIGLPGAKAMNNPTWYLSVLITGSPIIFYMLRKLSRKMFCIIALIVIVITYLYLVTHSANIEQWDTVGYVFFIPFWRGLADMLIGTLLAQVPEPSNRVYPQILECCSLAGVLLFLMLPGNYDYLTVILIILLVWSLRSGESVLRRIGNVSIIDRFGKYQYSVYVNHASVLWVFQTYMSSRGINAWILTFVVLLTVFVVAVADKTIIDKIKPKIAML